jgi:hypothetical protein
MLQHVALEALYEDEQLVRVEVKMQGDGSSKGEGNIRIEAFLMPTKVKKVNIGRNGDGALQRNEPLSG